MGCYNGKEAGGIDVVADEKVLKRGKGRSTLDNEERVTAGRYCFPEHEILPGVPNETYSNTQEHQTNRGESFADDKEDKEGEEAIASEADVEYVEVEIGEHTPPLTLVAVVTSFIYERRVQCQALRYLSILAYEHQEDLQREDIMKQLITVYEATLHAYKRPSSSGQTEGHTEINVAPSPPKTPCSNPSLTTAATHTPRAHCELTDIIVYTLRTFVALTQSNPETQQLLLSTDLLSLILHTLSTFPFSDFVLTESVRLLSILTSSKEGKLSLSSHLGLDALLTTLQTNPDNLSLQQDGCRMLSQLANACDLQVTATFNWSLIVLTLRSAKKAHPANPTINSVVAQAVNSILQAYRVHSKTEGVKNGEVKFLCNLAEYFHYNTSLHGQLSHLLCSLAEEHSDKVLSEGGVEAVLKLMEADCATVHVFTQGVKLIHTVAKERSRVEFLVGIGCLASTLTSLRYHLTSHDLAEASLTTLQSLVSLDFLFSLGPFLAHGGVPAIQETLTHNTSPTVHKLANEILLDLSPNMTVRKEILERNGAVVITSSLKKFPHTLLNSSLLLRLAQTSEGVLALQVAIPVIQLVGRQSLDGLKASDNATKTNAGDDIFCLHETLLDILALVTVLKENKQVCADHGAVQYILETIWHYKQSQVMASPGIQALVNLSSLLAPARHIRHNKGVNIVEYVARHHPSLSETCAEVLSNLDNPVS